MGPVPAVVLVVRHGARLDAADKQWHLSSPTPYDPPLTYGGWTQCRTLGTRIARLLHKREEDLAEASESDGSLPHNSPSPGRNGSLDSKVHEKDSKGKRRKHKVIIHSSPFLRCVQTSIAISAGISQYEDHTGSRLSRTRPRSSQKSGRSSSPFALASIPEPSNSPRLRALRHALHDTPHIQKTSLRIDAFLGEWLSPDYFDLITPPPNSTMMVAGAKADLLRRGEYVEAPQTTPNRGHFPGGWAHRNSSAHADEGSLAGLSSLAQALPLRERASSHSSVGSNGSRSSHRGATSIAAKNDNGLYTAPVPSYAVSPSDPIPRGYVAHARDACVDIDYQWDSMREPQDWGDGGEYGEEWSAMHKRFRKGINNMVDWYKEHGSSSHATEQWVAVDEHKDREDEDEDTDLVLVLVTHGAGCNALIGALTNQPVLLDVGMASLTMAVCRNQVQERRSSSPMLSHRPYQLDSHLSDLYEMRLVASTEHLRPGVDPSKLAQLPSPKVVPMTDPFQPRRRYFSTGTHAAAGSPIDAPFSLGEPVRAGSSMSAALGSIRRNSTTPSSSSNRSYSPSGTSSNTSSGLSGLWSRPSHIATAVNTLDGISEVSSSPGRDMVLNFGLSSGGPKPMTSNTRASTPEAIQEEPEEGSPKSGIPANPNTAPDLITSPNTTSTTAGIVRPRATTPNPPETSIGRSLSQHGLWGSKPLGVSSDKQERERGPKRRWTVNERD